jgi:pimeloyl-ACP methyl ester carboxylesterase
MIARRHVFHIGGYDPISPEQQLERFRRSLSLFQRTWGVKAAIVSGIDATPVSASWEMEASGSNWNTRTSYEMLRWDDLIREDHARGMWSRLREAFVTLVDFVLTGTLFRFMYSSWKYAGFFLFPYLYLAGFAACGAGIGYGLARLAGVTGFAAILLIVVATVVVTAGLLYLLGWRWPINHVFDDWIFSREFVYGQRPRMDARIDQFAERILDRVRNADVDEIVIVGHCLGAALVMDAVARALEREPELARCGPPLCILTVGATIPKFSLHSQGERIRQATQRVAGELQIRWTEYHARDDAISFYRFDPVTLKRFSRERFDGRPNIRRVQLHDMMDKASFRRHRFNFMLMHYKFLMGNSVRANYDHCLIICGPLPFDEITAPRGGVERFGEDGTLLAKDRPVTTAAAIPADAAADAV